MSCPYFYPLLRFDYAAWPVPAPLPLGDPYRGECRAERTCTVIPEETVIRQVCNFGYAGGRCGNFPDGPGPDAVRFSIANHDVDEVAVWYVLEAGHLPLEQGRLTYRIPGDLFSPAHPDERIQKQARAYVESYLRRVAA